MEKYTALADRNNKERREGDEGYNGEISKCI